MIDISRLSATDWIVCEFFIYLMALSIRRSLPQRHRLRVLAVGTACAGLAVMLSQLRPFPVLQVLREWVPAVYLLQGYCICWLFFQRPTAGLERMELLEERGLFLRRLTRSVLDHASVQANTFPSGHASVVVVTALAVATIHGPVGLVCGVVAASITPPTA